MQDRIKEHDRDIRLARTQTSAVAEHTNNTGHYPLWNEGLELKFLKHGCPRSKNTTTGELYDCGPPREQQYTSMQNTEDRNAPIRAVENQPITAQPCAL
ncbi:hypothetical protein ACROYT_G002449 [Oculina patagonica]